MSASVAVAQRKLRKEMEELNENGQGSNIHSYSNYDSNEEEDDERIEPWIPEEYIRPKWIHDTTNDITRMKRKTAAEQTVEAIQGWKMPEKPKMKPKKTHYQTDQRAMSVIQTVLDSTGHKGRTVSTTNAILGTPGHHGTRSSLQKASQQVPSGWVLMSKPKIMTATPTANLLLQQQQQKLRQQQQMKQQSSSSPENGDNNKKNTTRLVDLDLTSIPMFPSNFKGMTVQEMVQKMANQGKLVLENGKLVFRQPPGSEEMDLTVNVEPRYEDEEGLEEEELSPIITKVESISSSGATSASPDAGDKNQRSPIPKPTAKPTTTTIVHDEKVIKEEEEDDPVEDSDEDLMDELVMDVIKPEVVLEEGDRHHQDPYSAGNIIGDSSGVTYSYYADDLSPPLNELNSDDVEEGGSSYQIELEPNEGFSTTVGQFRSSSVVRRSPSTSTASSLSSSANQMHRNVSATRRDDDVFKRPNSFPSYNIRKIPISILKQTVHTRTRKQKLERVDPSSVVPVSVTNSTASSASESDLDIGEFPTDEDESESELHSSRNTVWVVPSRHHQHGTHNSSNHNRHSNHHHRPSNSSRSPSPNDLPEFELDEPEFILTTGSLQEVSPPKKRKQKHEPQPHTDGKIYPKPAFSYSCLIAMALKNSKTGSLPVSEIYKFMCDHFPYFKSAPSGWKNSVRHNLSLNKCFEKIEKPGNGARKGCLWALNPAKIHKMDEEVQKWSRKDPLAIRRAMSDPENLELIERGELKRDYSGNGASDEDDEEDLSEPCTPLTQAQLLARRSRGNSSDSFVGETTTVSSTTPTTKVSQVHAITLNRPIEQKIHVKSEPMDTLDFGTITNVQGNYLCHTGAGTGTYTLSFSPLSNATTPIIIRRTPVK